MIKYVKGDLLAAKTEAVVNTINTVGAMGKGIAKQFANKYPELLRVYRQKCKEKKINTGEMFVFELDTDNPKIIINFPTKKHWIDNSKMSYIIDGLKSLVEEIQQRNIKSISIPPLGCGNGNLEWKNVKPLIEEAFQVLPEVEVIIYEPI